jgi:hypothetical protein
MHLHTITALFLLFGLALMLYCVIQAEVSYRRVTRYLKQKAAERAADQAYIQRPRAG